MKRAKMLFAPLVLTALVIVVASPAVANTSIPTGESVYFLLGTTCPARMQSFRILHTSVTPRRRQHDSASFLPPPSVSLMA